MKRVVRAATLFLVPFALAAIPSAHAERDGGSESHGGDPMLIRQVNLARFVEREGRRLLISALRAVPLVNGATSRVAIARLRAIRYQTSENCTSAGSTVCVPVATWVRHRDELPNFLAALLRLSVSGWELARVDESAVLTWRQAVATYLVTAGAEGDARYLWTPPERGVCLVHVGEAWLPALDLLSGGQDLTWSQCVLESGVLSAGRDEAHVQFYPASGDRRESRFELGGTL